MKMTKDAFLNHIQGAAQGSADIRKIWEIAIKIDEKDPRWADIYDESESPVEAIRQFKKYFFGIEIQPKQRPKRRTQVERWTAEVEKVKARMIEYPDYMEAHKRRLAEMEANLAKAIKYNL